MPHARQETVRRQGSHGRANKSERRGAEGREGTQAGCAGPDGPGQGEEFWQTNQSENPLPTDSECEPWVSDFPPWCPRERMGAEPEGHGVPGRGEEPGCASWRLSVDCAHCLEGETEAQSTEARGPKSHSQEGAELGPPPASL